MATFSDTFTGTAGTLVTSHTPDSGGSWAAGTGTQTTNRPVLTDANRLRTDEATIDLIRASFTPASADYDVSCTFRHIGGTGFFAGVCGRYAAAAQTFYLLEMNYDGDEIVLQSCVAGSYSGALDSAAVTLNTATDYVLKLEMRGTAIKGYLDGVEVVSITNSDVTAAGGAGLQFYGDSGMTNSTGIHADNFSAADVSSGTVASDSWTEGSTGSDSFTPSISAQLSPSEGGVAGDSWVTNVLSSATAVSESWTEGSTHGEGFSTLELFLGDDEGSHAGDEWETNVVTVTGGEAAIDSLLEGSLGGDSWEATVVSHASWEEGAKGGDPWGVQQLPPLPSTGANRMHIRIGTGL